MSDAAIHAAVLEQRGVPHGFGTRASEPPPGTLRPAQVHGCRVAVVGPDAALELGEADAVVSTRPGAAVGVATADCVPVLAADESGRAVAAIHAGWRGLAAGVVEAAIAELARRGAGPERLVAAIGPRIGRCCYEVDAPVTEALAERYADALAPCLSASRHGHAWLDLGALVGAALMGAGVPEARVSLVNDACTRCDARRFHSYRRDAERAGRMVHWVAAIA